MYPPHYNKITSDCALLALIPYYRARAIAGPQALKEAGIGHGEHVVTKALVDVIEAGLKTRKPATQAKYAPHIKALREVAK